MTDAQTLSPAQVRAILRRSLRWFEARIAENQAEGERLERERRETMVHLVQLDREHPR